MAEQQLPEQGDWEDLRRWLEGQPREVNLAIASRAALRVLPLLNRLDEAKYEGFVSRTAVMLPLFRGMALPWVAAKYPTHGNELKSAAFAAAAAARAAAAAARAAAAADAAARAAAAAAAATFAAAAAARAAAAAAARADAAARAAAAADVAVQRDVKVITMKGVVAALREPLWHADQPDWVRGEWDTFKRQLLSVNEGWDTWVAIYDAVLEGAAEKLDEGRLVFSVTLNGEEDWEKGKSDPGYVNRLITGWPGTARTDTSKPAASQSKPGLKSKSKAKAKVSKEPRALPTPEVETEFISDRAQTEEDHLNRAEMAFALAGRINRFWNSNAAEGINGEGAGFVMHIDAPWGGGKTSFANYLTRILDHASSQGEPPEWMKKLPMQSEKNWPQAFRRPWFIVHFNAWQHQDVSPPWWVLYQVIRKGISKRLSYIERVSSLCREFWWRVATPQIFGSLLVMLPPLFIAFLLLWHGGVAKDDKGNLEFSGTLPQLVSLGAALVVVLLPFFKTVIPAIMSSLLPGTPDAAKNYALGSGDPLDRFRKHFATSMRKFERPILVVIDDLDRCKPDFVVELIRGMQTIFKSERVVYLLLCDRDWITEAFTVINDKMKAIEVGPEHEFGERFVEKAIQFSFVLPEPEEKVRQGYVRSVLKLGKAPDEAPKPAVEQLRAKAREAETIEDFETREKAFADIRATAAKEDVSKAEIESTIQSSRMRSSASGKGEEKAVRHQLEGLSHVLPANPRQVKRIFNTIGYLQQMSEGVFGGPEWQKLARWITLMIEWPKTWFTLSRNPKLIGEVFNPKTRNKAAMEIRKDPQVLALLDFKPQKGDKHWKKHRFTEAGIKELALKMPATSGKSWEQQ